MRKVFFLTGLVLLALTAGIRIGAQQRHRPPSLDFGSAYVSIGMTREQVEQNLAQGERHLELLPDKESAVVIPNGKSGPQNSEGEIMFADDRVVFASFDFPATDSANELAQEIAGMVAEMDNKVCAMSNYNLPGTGGSSLSETLFDCGGKGFDLSTLETREADGRYTRSTNLEVTIGALPRPK